MAITITPVRPVTDEESLELLRRNPGYPRQRRAHGRADRTRRPDS
jgi:hypothetical protein